MSVTAEFAQSFDTPAFDTPQPSRLRRFVIASVLIHLAVAILLMLDGGIFGVPGPGGGDALMFQLAAGPAQMEDAADGQDAEDVVEEPEEAAPEPEETSETPEPEPVAEEVVPVRTDVTPVAPPSETRSSDATALPTRGVQDSLGETGQGASGEGAQTILNRQGNSLDGIQITSKLAGRTLRLKIGRVDQTANGGNFLDAVTMKLNPDGTTQVDFTYYHYKTFHQPRPSTRSIEGSGKWWIENNRWCHSSKVMFYGTKDCYDMTLEGNTLRLYYAPCMRHSSQFCKTGGIAGVGTIE